MKEYNEHYRRAEGMTQTTISLQEELLENIKSLAASEDRSVSNFITNEMRKIVARRNKAK